MNDWSAEFERRLSAALSESRGKDGVLSAGAQSELTPPPTVNKTAAFRTPPDPTATFFDSICQKNRPAAEKPVGLSYKSPGIPSPARLPPVESLSLTLDGGRPAIQHLHESYSQRANDLHTQAAKQLDDVQTKLEKQQLDIVQKETEFLTAVAREHHLFSRPPDEWLVKIRRRENGMAPSEMTDRLVDRVAAMQTAAVALDSDLTSVWNEWDEAHKKVHAVLGRVLSGDIAGMADTADTADTRDGFGKIIAEAEKELEAAAEDALQEMKENEKTFRQLIWAEECKLAQNMLTKQSKYD